MNYFKVLKEEKFYLLKRWGFLEGFVLDMIRR